MNNLYLHTSEPDTDTERSMRAAGLVDIQEIDPAIAVHLVYATPYNFMGRTLYADIHKAFMLPELADKLAKARLRLKEMRPDVNLLVYDAARPLSIQQEMWDMVKGTPMAGYIADPTNRSGLHNYGAAIDVTLMDCTGTPLPMGSEYDYFGVEAHTDIETQMLVDGLITKRELDRRLLLRRVMTEQGLLTIKSEWWHFNLTTADEAREHLKIID